MDAYTSESAVYKKKFFASANSSKGFRNDFPRCFGEGSGVDRLYVIKGGPGTGKSHFMSTVGRYAEELGYDVTYYHCSSDPISLDGLKLEAEGHTTVGFLDGTAPHVWEPLVPGVVEDIINLGEFWDRSSLRGQSAEIKRLTCEKSKCYTRAYHYLSACGDVTSATDAVVAPCVRQDQMMLLAKRLLRQIPRRKAWTESVARLRGIGMSGCAYFDTFEKMSREMGGEIVCVDDYYGLGYRLTDCLYAVSKQNGLQVIVSHHPIHDHRIDGLFYPDSGLCILVGEEDEFSLPHRHVSMRRYLDNTGFRSVRGEVRHSIKLADELKACAVQSLKDAATYHFTLEKIYASAMDFKAKEKFENAFCKEIPSLHRDTLGK